jgi:DNA primase
MTKYIPPEIVERLESLDIEDVARNLGLDVARHKARCFMHEDHNPSLSFHKDRHRWKCFVCNEGGGSAISLVQKRMDCDFIQACEWLCSEYGIFLPNHAPIYLKPVKPYMSFHPLEQERSPFRTDIALWIIQHAGLSDLAKRFLFEERKLNSALVAKLKIGSITNSKRLLERLLENFTVDDLVNGGLAKMVNGKIVLHLFTPCLIFPYFDENNELLIIQTRYLGEKGRAPRFLFPPNQRPRIFNQPLINQLQSGDNLYISEGVTDCLALLSAGLPAVAVPSAKNIPLDDLRKLKDFRLHMYPDNDEAGDDAFRMIRSKLVSMGSNLIRCKLPEGYKDFSEYYIDIER